MIKHFLPVFPFLATLCMPAFASSVLTPPPIASKPNMLFILTDDQRFNALHAAGCNEISTPAMDQLASEGLTFTQATIMGGNSAAVCLPSRSMIITGNSLFRCGGYIPRKSTTLPQLLRNNGYATFATGKWHNDEDSLLRSFEYGTAIFLGGMGNHFDTPVSDIGAGKLVNPRSITDFDAERFTSATIDFLKNRPMDKPFFAYLSFKTPHDPRVVPPRFHQMYDAAKIPLPPQLPAQTPFR